MTQLDFGDYAEQPAARAGDPTTSKLAALAAGRAPQKARVARALFEHGPMCDERIAATSGVAKSSAAKRRHDLVSMGLVQVVLLHGEPIITTTDAGSPAQVWELTRHGRAVAADLPALDAPPPTTKVTAADLQDVIDLLEAGRTFDAIDILERWKP